MLALFLIFVAAGIFMLAERRFPGRALPASTGWYVRAALLNGAQLGIFVLGGLTWSVWLKGPSLFDISTLQPAILQGFVCWFVGTFVFYWWHRLRHGSTLLWRGLHQIHHSASRIETLTSFYKHPIEIAVNSILSTAMNFVVLGASVEAAAWYGFFAAIGEFCYHSNLRTPRFVSWFLQRPEQHSVHHQFEVHTYNFGDITWWDRLFGTFRDADEFVQTCGFAPGREQKICEMLAFRDVNRSDPGTRA